MNIKRLFVLILFLSLSSAAHADYKEMKSQLQSYRPPLYYDQQMKPVDRVEIPDRSDAFLEEIKQIDARKSGWKKAMIPGSGDKEFLTPDPVLLNRLKGVDTDPDKALEILKRPYSLEELEILTLLRNPGIKAEENLYIGILEAFSQVSALDEILRQYTAFTEGLMTGAGPMKGKEPIEKKFPFPGILSLKSRVVDSQAAAQKEVLEAARRDAVTRIRTAYWNLVYTIKAKKIISETLTLLKHLESVVNARYQSGRTSYQDAIKIRIKRQTLEEDLVTQIEKQHNFESQIAEILNLEPQARFSAPKTARVSYKIPALSKLYANAQKNRQEIKQFHARIKKIKNMIEMAETMILPPYTLGFSINEDEAIKTVGSFSKKPSFSLKTSASSNAGLPKMPWYGIEDAYLRETRQKLAALKSELKKEMAKTNTMVRNVWFKLDRAGRESRLYKKDVVKLSESALNVSTRSYESGNLSFADMIDSYTNWLNANLRLERNLSDLGIARAELEQAIGSNLN